MNPKQNTFCIQLFCNESSSALYISMYYKMPQVFLIRYGKTSNDSLGNPCKDQQRFVDAVVLVAAPDDQKASEFENSLKRRSNSAFEL